MLLDVELSIRGILRGFGLKVGPVTRKTFEARIRELVTGHTMLERIAEAMLSARATLQAQYEKLHKAVLAFVHMRFPDTNAPAQECTVAASGT